MPGLRRGDLEVCFPGTKVTRQDEQPEAEEYARFKPFVYLTLRNSKCMGPNSSQTNTGWHDYGRTLFTARKNLNWPNIQKTVLKEGYEEDNSISNIKLVVGVIACSFALVSHFYPLPFPQNIFVLEFCCIGYVFSRRFFSYLPSDTLSAAAFCSTWYSMSRRITFWWQNPKDSGTR